MVVVMVYNLGSSLRITKMGRDYVTSFHCASMETIIISEVRARGFGIQWL